MAPDTSLTPTSIKSIKRVLFIDDELVTRTMIGSVIKKMLGKEFDVNVTESGDLKSGLAALEATKPGEGYDLIFCDMLMPDTTEGALRVIKWLEDHGKSTPVIMMSNQVPQEPLDTAIPVHKLTKPFELPKLQGILRNVFNDEPAIASGR